MTTVKDDPPVLNSVVETGNKSIIKSTRLGHEVLAELESLRQSASVAVEPTDDAKAETSNEEQGHLNFDFSGPVELIAESDSPANGPDVDANESIVDDDPLLSAAQPTLFNKEQLEDEQIELMIDEVVDRHITELRKDIKRLLERAKNVP